MSQDKTNSGTPHLSTDDLINDYLSDMFGSESAPATVTTAVESPLDASCETHNEPTPKFENQPVVEDNSLDQNDYGLPVKQLEKINPDQIIDVFGGGRVSTIEAISPGLSLVPTIKLIRDDNDKGYRSQCEAQIILLTFLFFLRKPLSPRVRKTFLDFSEQAIDDYYAACWLAESAAESVQ